MCSGSEALETALPTALYRAEQVRALDRYAIDSCEIPGLTLMQRAGDAAFAVLRARWPEVRAITVVCGRGNNGGDGYVIARLAHQAGFKVSVRSIGDPGELSGDALAAAQAMLAEGLEAIPSDGSDLAPNDMIVDAILGTGLDREVSGTLRNVIEAINRADVPVLGVDIPSGLHADTGQILGAATRADATVSFIGLKQGLFTAAGPSQCGAVYFSDLGVPSEVYQAVQPSAERIDYESLCTSLGPRDRSSHKGHFGHVLVIGGDHGYAGAARMAAHAAARVGAGLVSLATRTAHAASVCSSIPEVMCHGVEGPDALGLPISQASVIAIGPGLGRSPWAVGLLAKALEARIPMVVDADALNLLAIEAHRRDNWILTPHPGEAARLLARTNSEIQAARFESAEQIQQRYGGVCVLKGAGTIVTDGASRPAVCNGGNPGMATGGMGDVLTGVIAGLVAQGMALADSAKLGVAIHAKAGDLAAGDGERGLMATDLMPWIRRLANPSKLDS